MSRMSPDTQSPYDEASQSPQSVSDQATPLAPSGGLSKSWIVPPRPKPGRKPATDTPPSKRKAQNREAQRAFRERRAARVGELEDELRQKEKEHESEKDGLRRQFEEQRVALQQDIATWRVRSENWERVVKEKEADISELKKQIEQMNLSTTWPSPPSFPAAKQGWERSHSASQRPLILPLPVPSNHDSLRPTEPPTPAADCRKCGQGGHCACMEKILSNLPEPAANHIRSGHASPIEIKQETHDDMEIDFTSRFATSKSHGEDPVEAIMIDDDDDVGISPGGSIRVTDGCGFCTDDKNCLCMQTARDEAARNKQEASRGQEEQLRLAPMSRPQPVEPASGAGGPGSCPSCVIDPERRRFCQALAGVSTQTGTTAKPSPAPPAASRGKRSAQMFGSIDSRMSCSDTYDYLRKNMPDFATKRDSVSFIQQLRPRPSGHEQHNSSASPYEVEAASVLSVMSRSNGGSYADGQKETSYNDAQKRDSQVQGQRGGGQYTDSRRRGSHTDSQQGAPRRRNA